MLDNRQKFSLMFMYMRPVLIISGLGSISAVATMMMVSTQSMAGTAGALTVLKILLVSISSLLFTMMSSKDRKFFYINVGISTRKLMTMAIILDLSVFFLMMILIIIVRHAIN